MYTYNQDYWIPPGVTIKKICLIALKFMDGHLHFLEVKNSEILIENTLHISTENVWLVAGRVGNLEKFGF